MPKPLFLVFQDCPFCGAREKWGEEQTKLAEENGFEIIKKPFYVVGARRLVLKAIKADVRMPFFTDGTKFSKTVEDFIAPAVMPEEAPKKVRKSRKKKEIKDGSTTESK